MQKLSLSVLIAIISVYFPSTTAFAISDPLAVPNNIYGIHITNEADLDDAAALVNSSGGDWGYVTFVIRQNQRDTLYWNKVFSKLTNLHLIPLVRIASTQNGSYWDTLDKSQIQQWSEFLDSLNWPTQNRYTIIGNEPNHAKEWGGEVSPAQYADYLKQISIALKQTSDNFFILPAGFDASAPNSTQTMDEVNFLTAMQDSTPDIFDHIDGWTSHSYPNPAFSGSPADKGRGTITTYQWEIQTLTQLGVTKPLPVFITETGWIQNPIIQNEQVISDNFEVAFTQAWQDSSIVAVTPFILNYPEEPFMQFSWKMKGSSDYYSFYSKVKSLPKPKGDPKKETKTKIYQVLPLVVRAGTKYLSTLILANTGNSVIPDSTLTSNQSQALLYSSKVNHLEPGNSAFVALSGLAPTKPGVYQSKLRVNKEPTNSIKILSI